MKILKLRFKNLNSLHGEWQIDFTADDYTADGIFAITGPTGAGKSRRAHRRPMPPSYSASFLA